MKALLIVAAVLAAAGWFLSRSADSWPLVNEFPTGTAIVAFGDSLTAGTGAGDGRDYPSQLASMIGEPVINAGVPGDTTAEALGRVDAALDHDPRIALVTLGGNDLRRGVDRDAAFANLEEIVRRFQARGALVVIGGLEVPLFGRGFGDAYRELAERTGSLLVPNVLEDLFGEPELMADRIHPNADGYTIMARRFHDVLIPHLGTAAR